MAVLSVTIFASIQIVGGRVSSLFSRANTAFGSTGMPVPTGSSAGSGSGSGSGSSPAEFVWNPSSASGLDSTNSNPSPPQTLQVMNIGGNPGTPGAISLTGADASRFEILTNECTSSLAVNAGCNVIVRALPGPGATYTANLVIAGSSAIAVLNGNNGSVSGNMGCLEWFGGTDLSITPPTNPVSRELPLILQNSCPETHVVNPVLIPVNGVQNFGAMQLTSDNCQGATLDQGTACTVSVSLDATRNGDYTSILRAKPGDTSIGNTTLQGPVTAHVPPVWSASSGNLQQGVMGTDFSLTAQVTDQNGDMTPVGITIIAGALPQGLISNFGVNGSDLREWYITGIPNEVGTFTITARIEDEAGHIVDQVVTMEIFPPINNLVLTGDETFNLSAAVPEVINTFTFRNESPDTTAPVGAVLTPPSQTRFTIINDQCNGIRLTGFTQCTMQVRAVRDGAPGVYTASFISGGGIYGSNSINRTLTINQN